MAGVQDPSIAKLAKLRASRTGKLGSNAARDFQRYVWKEGKALDIKISTTSIFIKRKVSTTAGKRRTKKIKVDHPVVYFSSWMECLLQKYPAYLLGGNYHGAEAQSMFGEFWDKFQPCCPHHPIYNRTQEQRRFTIPIAVHGDEGRGLAKTPCLIISYQVVIPFSGPNELNSSKLLGLA